MVAEARRIAERAGLACVVANDGSVMGAAETRALLVRADDVTEYTGPKAGLGLRVADELITEIDP